ncbi:transporter substrate-binding domain-containing protein [Nitrincola nitratireducens]|uniref:substrate-binding periplasmic protein n=1 Tax=Nitrincola nitratireducens TaxID=1229521 RepID=UPI00307BA446
MWGTATQLLKRLIEHSGLEAEFQLLPWARAITEAEMRENTCVYSATRTHEREPLFKWIGPLVSNQWAAFSLASSSIEASGLDDLSGLRLGSFREDAVGRYVQDQGHNLILATADHENLDRLNADLIDVWITGVAAANYLADRHSVSLKKLFVFNEVPLYLACNRSLSSDLHQKMQTTLDILLQQEGEALSLNQYNEMKE